MNAKQRTLLTIAEAADRLRVSGTHMRRMIADGRMAAHCVSPRIMRIAEDDLLEYLERCRVESSFR